MQAIIKREALGARWVGYLRALSTGRSPLKWRDVSSFVREGQGHESRSVRDGLGEQTIVVTDPMHLPRQVDVHLLESGQVPAPIFGMLLVGAKRRRGDGGTGLLSKLGQWIAQDLLAQSGIGEVESLMRMATSDNWVRRPDGLLLPVSTRRFIARCNGDLSRVAKLATQSTALVAEHRDPDTIEPDLYPWAEAVDRFNLGPTSYEARHLLRRIGRANIIFDHDEAPITGMVEEVRSAAEITGSWDWMEESHAPEGAVRTGDDAKLLKLQLADVAAGYASALIQEGGLIAVVTRFRFVLYNGERLTPDEAVQFDKLRAIHRTLLSKNPLS